MVKIISKAPKNCVYNKNTSKHLKFLSIYSIFFKLIQLRYPINKILFPFSTIACKI